MNIPQIIEALYKNSILLTHYTDMKYSKASEKRFNEYFDERKRLYAELKKYME